MEQRVYLSFPDSQTKVGGATVCPINCRYKKSLRSALQLVKGTTCVHRLKCLHRSASEVVTIAITIAGPLQIS